MQKTQDSNVDHRGELYLSHDNNVEREYPSVKIVTLRSANAEKFPAEY